MDIAQRITYAHLHYSELEVDRMELPICAALPHVQVGEAALLFVGSHGLANCSNGSG